MPTPTLSLIAGHDSLSPLTGAPCPGVVHTEHRWTLPLARLAQLEGQLPAPCDLFMLDAHPDGKPPLCHDKIRDLRAAGCPLTGLVDLTANHLSTMDDDWLQAGMELGIVRNAVVLGVHSHFLGQSPIELTDHTGSPHWIHLDWLPHSTLTFKGSLTSQLDHPGIDRVWTLLGWRCTNGHFGFLPNSEPLLGSIDLDTFMADWQGHNFVWPDTVWDTEMHTPATYGPVAGWTGASFLRAMLARVGFLTVSREPDFCGGISWADHNFDRLNRYLFDNALNHSPL